MQTITNHDRDVLRRLAARVAEIAALPCQRETAAAWARLNRRQPGRPLVWINELPWHELNVNDELTLVCQDPDWHAVESALRMTLYQWAHLRGDMVVERTFWVPMAIHDTGFGIGEVTRTAATDAANGVVSREFTPQIQCERDLDKIKTPVISHDAAATTARLQQFHDLFGDLLDVRPYGVGFSWFAPWDELIRWWGVQEAMMDLVLRPELVHAAMDRLVTAYLARLDQWEKLNLLSPNNGNFRIGSGGLGYTDELPAPGFDQGRVRPLDQWGNATAQIFSEVSPEMHEEFALHYERRWLRRFGQTYYGCCEPLWLKLDILKSVPNLRKVSMSPWNQLDRAAERIGRNYVFSFKPNPAVLATDTWNLTQARRELEAALAASHGCVVEIILKDVSTVRYEPQRVWEWAAMAKAVAAA
ncbi:MAG: hypothetical protein WCH61_06680 [bacterium]